MAVRISSFQHSVAVVGAVLFSYGILLFSASAFPVA